MLLQLKLQINFSSNYQIKIYCSINNQIMDQYSQLTAHYIQQRFKLPKIAAKKIEQANRFINDPSSALKSILQRNHKQQRQLQKNMGNRTSRKDRQMKKSFTIDLDEKNYELDLISEKMRKYKPANGSHSQFYADQLLMDLNRGKKVTSQESNGLELSKIHFSSKRDGKERKKSPLYRLSTSRTQEFLNEGGQSSLVIKLREIRENSELLRQNSRHLLRKADSAFVLNEHSYEKLRDDSNRIISGQEKYVLDQQFTSVSSNKAHNMNHTRR